VRMYPIDRLAATRRLCEGERGGAYPAIGAIAATPNTHVGTSLND